jgi:amino acid transporter
MTAEFKGGGQRSRQLKTIVGAGLGQSITVIIAAYIFLHTIGYDFFVSALNGSFTAPGGTTVGTAGYVYFASLVAKSSFVVTILSLTFLGWWLPGQYINAAMMQRALLAWSLDGVAPKIFSRVNDRTHTPIVSIVFVFLISIPVVAWVAFSSDFFAFLSMSALYNFFPICLVGLSAVLMRRRRADLYRGSAADWRVAGVEVLPIAGAGAVIGTCFLIYLGLHFHTNIGITDGTAFLGLTYFQLEWLTPIVVFAVSAAWYYAVKTNRQRDGVNIELAYKEIPPA